MNPGELLTGIPEPFRAELLKCYESICRNYSENRWEASELNGGKFAEAVYCVLRATLDGGFPSAISKPSNMLEACRALEQAPADPRRAGDRSLRILIPRLLPVLYEIRNNRGVGHVGGDVDPNHEDAEAVLAMANWVMAELVRIFHGMAPADAQAAVERIVSRRHPVIWKFEGGRRVLDTSLKTKDQVLLLLYTDADWVDTADLQRWIEYSNLSVFRSSVLAQLHRERLIEHDIAGKRAKISPKGIMLVEGKLM